MVDELVVNAGGLVGVVFGLVGGGAGEDFVCGVGDGGLVEEGF